MMTMHHETLVLGFLLALGLAVLLVPAVRWLAFRFNWVDIPDARKIHTVPIPRLGGVGIWGGFMLAFVLISWVLPALLPTLLPMLGEGSKLAIAETYGIWNHGVWGILAGSAIMFVIGVLDDIRSLSPYVKLAGQLAAAVVAYCLGVQMHTLDLPGSKLLVLHGLALPFTVLWLMAISNAINFIDGVDGLAGGVTTLSAVTLVVVALFTHQPVAAFMAALLAGATLGFLAFNLHPARIFMGDSGALFCGFMLAAIAVTGVLKTKVAVVLLPVLVLSVPILDIFFATFRRLLKGKNPFLPDAEHLHHKLLQAGLSQRRTVLAFYTVCILAGLLATDYVHNMQTYVLLVGGVLLLGGLLTFIVRRVFPHNAG